jgi:hypothetical protein
MLAAVVFEIREENKFADNGGENSGHARFQARDQSRDA